MNRNNDITPQESANIERYIFKQMPQDEYDAFTKRLQEDEDLREKTKNTRLLLVGIQEAELTDRINDFHKTLAFKQKKAKVFSLKQWLVAASVVALVGLSALLFFNHFNSQEKLFNEYYKPDPGLITAMGMSQNYLFDHAMIDYKTKNYDRAIQAWKQLLAEKPANDTLNYFIGSALLANDKAEAAVPYFEKVLTDSSSYFLYDTYWYLGLALVKQQKSEKAIPYIQKAKHANKEAFLQKLKSN